MFLVSFENRTSSTRSSSGNGAGIDVSLHKGTILKGMLPKLKSSKYILVYRSSLGTFCPCTIPRNWKKTTVVPIHKGSNRSVVENYRPVSLTSVVCKQMEHVIAG